MNSNSNTKNSVLFSVALAVLLLFEFVFLGGLKLFTKNYVIGGDSSSVRYATVIEEHWYKVFNGEEAATDFPGSVLSDKSIETSDLLFGRGIVYSFFRLCGLEEYQANNAVVVLLHTIGTISLFIFLNKRINCGLLWSILGSMAFSFSDSLMRNINGTAQIEFCLIPLLILLLSGVVSNYSNRLKRSIFAASFILSFALMSYSIVGVLNFVSVFALIFLVVFVIGLRKSENGIIGFIKTYIKPLWIDLFVYAVVSGCLTIPYFLIFRPVMRNPSGYDYTDCSVYLPEFADLINVSENNILFGWLVRSMRMPSDEFAVYKQVGFSVILLVMFLIFYFVYRKNNCSMNKSADLKFTVIRSVFLSVILSILFSVKLSTNSVSLWQLIRVVLPYTKSTLVVSEFWLLLSLPIAVITAYTGNSIFESVTNVAPRRKLFTVITPVILIVLVGISYICRNASEVSNIPHNYSVPPADASVFCVKSADDFGSEEALIEGLEIAEFYDLDYINGYNVDIEVDGEKLDISDADYYLKLYDISKEFDYEDIYIYDVDENKWSLLADEIDSVFYPKYDYFSVTGGLIDYNAGEFVWASEEMETIIYNPDVREDGLSIHLATLVDYYMLSNPYLNYTINVFIDDEYMGSIPVTDGYKEVSFDMSTHDSDWYSVRITTNCTFIPSEIGLNADTREMSYALYYIGNDIEDFEDCYGN